MYLFRWHPYSFSYLSHFQSRNLHGHFMHFCNKVWGSSNFWPSSTRITSKLSRPNLNSLVHLVTVEYERAESPGVFWKSAWISFAFIPFFMKYLITAQIADFPFSQFSTWKQQQRVATIPVLQQEHWHTTCSLIKDAWLLHGNLVALALTFRGDSKNFSNHPRKLLAIYL